MGILGSISTSSGRKIIRKLEFVFGIKNTVVFPEARTSITRHQDAVRQEKRCIGDAKLEKGVGIGCTQSNS